MESSSNILVVFLGSNNAGPVYAYEMTKGLVENGANVYAVISSYACNIEDWRTLPLKMRIEVNTYRSKREFLFRTIVFLFAVRHKIRARLKGVVMDRVYVPFYSHWGHWVVDLFPQADLYYTVHDPLKHSGESLINRVFFCFEKKDIRRAKKVVILSSIFRSVMRTAYQKADSDILVIPHGTFSSYTQNSLPAEEVIDWYRRNADRVNFLFFGRIETYKGIDMLLQAYQAVEKEYSQGVSLLIAGKGDFQKHMAVFKTLHRAKLINRMIRDEEVNSLFQGNCVVTVLPYRDATQSGVINLAMQNGSLVLATDVGGLPEQLGYGKWGVLLAPQESVLQFEMRQVVTHFFTYSRYIDAARDASRLFTWKALAHRILE